MSAMKIFAAWTMTVALTLAACGGDVVLDSSGAGAGNAGAGAIGGRCTICERALEAAAVARPPPMINLRLVV